MTSDELINYFNEHVLYELLMLRHAKKSLESTDQLSWNMAFAAFNVNARNLYRFLSNSAPRTDMRACNYDGLGGGYQKSDITKITGALQRLNKQCMHLGNDRPNTAVGKVEIGQVREIFDWVERNMTAFVDSRSEYFRARIDVTRADPERIAQAVSLGPTGPTISAGPTKSFATTPVTKADLEWLGVRRLPARRSVETPSQSLATLRDED